jgi:hypothetical protein
MENQGKLRRLYLLVKKTNPCGHIACKGGLGVGVLPSSLDQVFEKEIGIMLPSGINFNFVSKGLHHGLITTAKGVSICNNEIFKRHLLICLQAFLLGRHGTPVNKATLARSGFQQVSRGPPTTSWSVPSSHRTDSRGFFILFTHILEELSPGGKGE